MTSDSESAELRIIELNAMARQQTPLRAELQADAEKLAMFDDLVELLDSAYHAIKFGETFDGINTYDFLSRARLLQGRSK